MATGCGQIEQGGQGSGEIESRADLLGSSHSNKSGQQGHQGGVLHWKNLSKKKTKEPTV